MATSNYVRLTTSGYVAVAATSGTAVGLTGTWSLAASAASATLSEPNYCLIVPETSAIRWRDDGTAAVCAVSGGMPLAVGQYMEYDGNLRKVSIVSQGSTATVHVHYYRVS